jgi:hypothetical protein
MAPIGPGNAGCGPFEQSRARWGGTEDVHRRLWKEWNWCCDRKVSSHSTLGTIITISNHRIDHLEVVHKIGHMIVPCWKSVCMAFPDVVDDPRGRDEVPVKVAKEGIDGSAH